MPIAGSEIVKMLPGRRPRTDCGFPTCFTFAMKLASGEALQISVLISLRKQKLSLENPLAPGTTCCGREERCETHHLPLSVNGARDIQVGV